jgi:hypothetical protein
VNVRFMVLTPAGLSLHGVCGESATPDSRASRPVMTPAVPDGEILWIAQGSIY